MSSIPPLVQALQTVLTDDATTAARATGFVQRQSKLTGAVFAQTLVFGWLANAQASLEELTQTAAIRGVVIRPQGLDQRFTDRAAACLQQILQAAVRQVVGTQQPVAIPLLQRFTSVSVLDSSTIVLPDALATVWPGCGGSQLVNTQAALKVQVRLDLCSGHLDGPLLQAGRVPDSASPFQTTALPAGALRLADLGYFDLDVLTNVSTQEAWWLSRLHRQTTVYDATGQVLDVLTHLQATTSTTVDLPIFLGKQHRLAARLLAERVPQEVADQRRRRLRREARDKGHTLTKRTLALAAWTILVTNVPVAQLSVAEALVLMRARWQIELLFKLWKSQGQIDAWRSTKPWRILCEVYAKLVGMVVQHWVLLVSCWQYVDRSLGKAARTVQKHAWQLASTFDDPATLTATLAVIHRCLAVGCRINKRKQAPPTYQLLLACVDWCLA